MRISDSESLSTVRFNDQIPHFKPRLRRARHGCKLNMGDLTMLKQSSCFSIKTLLAALLPILYQVELVSQSLTVNIKLIGEPDRETGSLIIDRPSINKVRFYNLQGQLLFEENVGVGERFTAGPFLWDNLVRLGRYSVVDLTVLSFSRNGNGLPGLLTYANYALGGPDAHVIGVAPSDLDKDGLPEGLILADGELKKTFSNSVGDVLTEIYEYEGARSLIRSTTSTQNIPLEGRVIGTGSVRPLVLSDFSVVFPVVRSITTLGMFGMFRFEYSISIEKIFSSPGGFTKANLFSETIPFNYAPECFIPVDLDQDGTRDDLILLTRNSSLIQARVYKAPDYSLAFTKDLVPWDYVGPTLVGALNCSVLDLNSDGFEEVLLFGPGLYSFVDDNDDYYSYDGLTVYVLRLGRDDVVVIDSFFRNTGELQQVLPYDIDGDGRDEVLALTAEDNPKLLTISLEEGLPNKREPYITSIKNMVNVFYPFSVPGVRITVDGKTAFTDLSGQARFFGLPHGTKRLDLKHNEFRFTGNSTISISSGLHSVTLDASFLSTSIQPPDWLKIQVNRSQILLEMPSRGDSKFVFEYRFTGSRNVVRRVVQTNKISIRRPRRGFEIWARGAYKVGSSTSSFTRWVKRKV